MTFSFCKTKAYPLYVYRVGSLAEEPNELFLFKDKATRDDAWKFMITPCAIGRKQYFEPWTKGACLPVYDTLEEFIDALKEV